jgi:hypothetical protein
MQKAMMSLSSLVLIHYKEFSIVLLKMLENNIFCKNCMSFSQPYCLDQENLKWEGVTTNRDQLTACILICQVLTKEVKMLRFLCKFWEFALVKYIQFCEAM